MKNLLMAFVLIVAAIIVTGCSKSPKEIVYYNGWTSPIGTIYRIEIEGHTYLIRDKCDKGGICHDENCKCKKQSSK